MTLVAAFPSASRVRARRRLAAALVVPTALVGAALLSGPAARADVAGAAGSLTRTVADGPLDWTVPAGVHSLTITAVGGSGAAGADGYQSAGGAGGAGGHGARVREDVQVVPGEVLSLWPGGAATSASGGVPGSGLGPGGNGGEGDPLGGDGGGGGAASAVASPSVYLAVAGGGGGGGAGGINDLTSGGDGGSAGAPGSTAQGGGAGAGGNGHVADDIRRDMGQDGVPAAVSNYSGGGGGGGGGLDSGTHGGGLAGDPGSAAGSGGGGAGGLSLAADPAATFDIAPTTGDGSVTLTWGTRIGTATTLTALTHVAVGTPVTFTAAVTPSAPGGQPVGGTVAFERVDPVTGVRSLPVLVPIADGRASWTVTPTTFGDVGVEALYNGDDGHSGSRSGVRTTSVVRPAPGLSVSANRLLIGDVPVGSSATQTVTLTNTGNLDWSASGGVTIGDPAVSLDTSQCPSLVPDAACTLPVTFRPTAVGPFVTTVTFGVGSSTAAFGVFGTGVAGVSTLSATPSPLAFGNVAVGSVARRTVTLTNTGNVTWSTVGAGAGNGVVDLDAASCATVAPGAGCTATVTFSPVAAGPVGTTLTLLGASGTASIPVTGTGVVAAAKPVVTRISPAKGPKAGGTLVTITGRNLTGVTAIRIGGVLMRSVHCTSSSTCTAVTPKGTVGKKDVRVVTPAGTSAVVAADKFSYV